MLIERASELAALNDAVATAASGTPAAVVIEGPAGIGKTALLRAGRRAAAARGLLVLSARGGELEQGLSLGVARQLFERPLRHASDRERAELLAGAGGFVVRLLDPDQGGADPGRRVPGLNALYLLSVRLAERSPVMFAIDDLHWADPASLRWLAYLIRRLEDLPVLLALARRSGEGCPNADLLARIAAEPGVRHIRPGPLGVRGVGALAAGVFGVPPQARFAAACHLAAGGNPLFTVYLLEAAQGEGLRPVGLDADAVAELAPERVAELALSRLNRLTPAAVTVAESVALQRLAEALSLAGDGRSATERELLGMAAMVAPAPGATSSETAEIASRALDEADLSTVDGLRLITCPVWALEFAGRLDEADQWLLRIQEAAQRSGWPSQFLLAASARAEVCCRRGALADAEQEARAALELADAQNGGYGVIIATAALVMSLTEQGRLAEADTLLAAAPDGRGAPCDLSVHVLSRGWFQLARGRAAAAATEFRQAARLMRQSGHDVPGFWPWRVGAAAAGLALGRGEDAAELSREQLDRTRAFGAAGPMGVALRALGLARHGPAQLDLLAAACAELDRSPALLDRAKAHLEHGAALRRAGYRTDARQRLQNALDLASRCGAEPVARRAREELTAAGARPRRVHIYGVAASTYTA